MGHQLQSDFGGNQMTKSLKLLVTFLLVFLSLSGQAIANHQINTVNICGKVVEIKKFRDYTPDLGHASITLINQIIENFEFDALEGSFVSCGKLSTGIGWAGDFKVGSKIETRGYFIRF
jgi:hypothetical protein